MVMTAKARISHVTTKLKCKPCNLFFKDEGYLYLCPKCGEVLRRIKVHHVQPKNITIFGKENKIGGRK